VNPKIKMLADGIDIICRSYILEFDHQPDDPAVSAHPGARAHMIRYPLVLSCLLTLLLSGWDAPLARGEAPQSCSLLTLALVSAAVGQPATGGQVSVVDNPSSTTSACMYKAGAMLIVVEATQLPSAVAGRAEFDDKLKNSDTTQPEPGLGDGAFFSKDGPALALTALRGARIIVISLVGGNSAAIPRERLHGLMQTALSH
jgi:hypothetical protein